jgi:hypothetical protein
VKKFTLKLEPEYDFYLMGISTPIKIYQLAYLLNQNLHTRFEKSKPHYLIFKGENRYYDLYVSKNDTVTLELLENQGSQDYLIPEYKNIDFWLKIPDQMNESTLEKFLEKIKKIHGINLVSKIDYQHLTSKSNLVLQI